MYYKKIILKNIFNALGKRLSNKRIKWSSGIRQVSSVAEKHIIKSSYPDVPISSKTILEFVWENVHKWPDHTAIVCGVTGRSYTYSQLHRLSQKFAVSLIKAGFGHGDTLAIILPNQPEYPLILLGAIQAGLKVTTVNPAYTASEISRQLKDCEARCVVTSEDCVTKLVQAYRQLAFTTDPCIITVSSGSNITEGTVNFEELISPSVDTSVLSSLAPLRPDDVAAIPYSSGTTGLPKGVMLTHRGMVTNYNQYSMEPDLNYLTPATSTHQDTILAVLPLFHIYGLSFVMLSGLASGAKIVTLSKFDPVTFVSTIHNYKCSILFLVPPLILFLATHPSVKANYLQSVEYIGSSAAPIGPLDVQRLNDKIPNVMFAQGYGMTEASPVLTLIPKSSRNIASVGKLVCSTEAKVVNLETGASMPVGEVGELCVRGPQIMKGYLNNPQATAETIDKEGWLHTGDLASYDQQHDFYIHDRLKELIKVKGLQVAPAELEEILRSHPHVSEAAVIGMPDSRLGEAPRAFVVVESGYKIKEEELKSFVAEKVSEHKHLSGGVTFVKNIPKNPAGKILRKVIKEQYL